MLDDAFIDAVLGGGYLPGIHSVTISDPAGNNAFTVDARREDPDAHQAASAGGVGQYGVIARVYFVWKDQAGFTLPRDRWQVTDNTDGTSWVAVRCDDGIQQREVVLSCAVLPT